ncbi:MAG: hypothetical protein QGF38_01915 [Rhodospirillales bacterium]|jgi:hypothetical protein|nr:hypothetical protein [Rhodospirillales bacterium]HJO97598.1 hypothetical protein [Rhodospirillales bacterium]
MTSGFEFAPLVAWPLIAGLAGVVAVLLFLSAWRHGRGTIFRAFAMAVLVLALANPRSVKENREAQPDVAIIVIDESQSQTIGNRRAEGEAALQALKSRLSRFSNLEVRISRTTGEGDGDGGTHLFQALNQAMAQITRQRFAGAVLITDGQVHDVPADVRKVAGPLHVLLTGSRDEKDRRMTVDQAPSYGIVGKEVMVSYRIDDRPKPAAAQRGRARIWVRRDGVEISSGTVPVGSVQQVAVPLEHGGPTVVELEVEATKNELSTLNNRSVIAINGVRDRLRVLLISGQPHAGERTWRNLLKSDPSVDLVHFTILRPPEKDDMTPLRELALIVFPIQELFEVKLKDFNLIVFDRYMVRGVLPPSYLRNIENYVREGGALMLAVGPEFAGLRSLFQTPLGAIMPGTPTGEVLEQGFRPAITDVGSRHPVTSTLVADPLAKPRWGRWFRQIEAGRENGNTLMDGIEKRPLLIVNRVEKGRVAQLMSDHIWLWARQFEGGGPQGEILRRLAHWLMKEPDLEEESLAARADGGQLSIERRSLAVEVPPVTVTAPSGATENVTLKAERGGRARATMAAPETGLYRVADGTRTTLAAVGALNAPELMDLRTTDERLGPTVAATGGGVAWVSDGVPEIRRPRAGRDTAGRGWMGLRSNESYLVTGVLQVSLLPGIVVLVLVLGGLTAAWWREGR